MAKVKISTITPCYNVDTTLKECLESIYPFVDQMVISEGSWNPDSKNPHSTDKALDIIDEFMEGKDNVIFKKWDCINPDDYQYYKCQYHKDRIRAHNRIDGHPFYNGKALTQQMLCRDWCLNMCDGDWVFLVDADELYKPEDLINLRKFLESNPKEHMLTIQSIVFYFDFWHFHYERFRRLFRRTPDWYFSDDNSIDSPSLHYDNSKLDLDENIVQCYHYAYVGDERVSKKTEMWNEDTVNNWLKKVWDEPNLYRAYLNNSGGVHLFGNINAGYAGYKLSKFNGEHPDIMKNNRFYGYRKFQ